jgi:hypothetical protein
MRGSLLVAALSAAKCGEAVADVASLHPGYGACTYQEKPPSKPRRKPTIIAAMIDREDDNVKRLELMLVSAA